MRCLLRSAPLVLFTVLSLHGCSGKKATSSADGANTATGAAGNAAENKPEESTNIATRAGSSSRVDPKSGKKLWTIRWKASAFTIAEKGITEGQMSSVNGEIFREDGTTSTFTADRGYAKRDSQTLRLESRVVVVSEKYKTTLKAEKLEWLPDVKRMKASGDVTVSGDWGTIGPDPSLMATPDLKIIGTPGRFPTR